MRKSTSILAHRDSDAPALLPAEYPKEKEGVRPGATWQQCLDAGEHLDGCSCACEQCRAPLIGLFLENRAAHTYWCPQRIPVPR